MKTERRQFLKTITATGIGLPFFVLGQRKTNSILAPETIKPAALKAGDTVAISSPAGAVWDEKQIDVFVSILNKLGFKVKTGKTLREKYGYFAGSDEMRAGEINDLFSDKNVKAIFCMKGGWGCARLLSKLNYETIKLNPKILIGFSDITSLLIAIHAKTGLITFHGPVGNSGWNDFTVDYFKKVLMKKEEVVYSATGKEEDKVQTIYPGKTSGILVGGNLSVLAGIIGSSYLPSWKNKILFLEETTEEPYRIDRMLTQLKLAGVLDEISGFVFGKCVKCTAEEPDKAFTFMQVLEQHIKPLNIPAFYGAMIGHIENKFTLPIGIKTEIDARTGAMKLAESATI